MVKGTNRVRRKRSERATLVEPEDVPAVKLSALAGEVVVLNFWVTATNETTCASKISTFWRSRRASGSGGRLVSHRHVSLPLSDVGEQFLQGLLSTEAQI